MNMFICLNERAGALPGEHSHLVQLEATTGDREPKEKKN